MIYMSVHLFIYLVYILLLFLKIKKNTLSIEYMSNITVYSNKNNGFCGFDFVAWISFAAWILVL